MKLFYAWAIVLATTTSIYSQKVDILWEGSKVYDYSLTKKITVPYFSNVSYQIINDIPYLSNSFKIQDKATYHLVNLQWQPIASNDLFDIDANAIPDREVFSTYSYLNRNTGEYFLNYSIATLKKEKNTYYKLISFDLAKETNESSKILSSPNEKLQFTSENPLKSGNFYKIKVNRSGIFKITASFLRSHGINPSSINPKNFKIYGNGGIMLPEFNRDFRFPALQENAIEVIGEEDGKWDVGDYALFYAQGPNGYNLYNRANGNGYKRRETRSTDFPDHLQNIYEDYSYYYINFDSSADGKRITVSDNALPASNLKTEFDSYQYINEEKFNLLNLGRLWVGDAFTGNKTITLTPEYPIKSGSLFRYRYNIIANNGNANSIEVKLNNNSISNLVFSGTDLSSLWRSNLINNVEGSEVKFEFIPNTSANPGGLFYLNYVEIQYKQDLNFNNTQMNFRDFSIAEGSNDTYGFSINNAAQIDRVWDVSDHTNSKKITNKSTSSSHFDFGYVANSTIFNNEFVAFKLSAAWEPEFIGRINNQDLSLLQNIDYLIITKKEFISEAQRLAHYHKTQNNFKTAVVDAEEIYNEYSSGSQDITAIRDFITRLNTPSGTLKYVLLIGDSSFDFKNKLGKNKSVLPSYQSEYSLNLSGSYITDDYFVMTQPQISTLLYQNLPDIPIGRLPAESLPEAKVLIDKTLAYYNGLSNQSTPFGDWRLKLDFVADDDKDGGTPFHTILNNNAIKPTFENTNSKPEYNVRKLYLDAFPAGATSAGQRYPTVNQKITESFSNSLFLFYLGHGGINGWAQERVLTSSEVSSLNNFNNIYSRFPLVSTITCDFTLWDNPNVFSVGEQVMKKNTGGAATMITSSREISVYYGLAFTPMLIHHIFDFQNDDFRRLGDSYLYAKQQYGPIHDHLRVNYLGDPAMTLSRPKKRIILDDIVPANQLKALDFVKITGHINKDDNSSIDDTFNGKITLNVFDKKLNKNALNNDGNLLPILTYTEEGNPIVKASGTVTNGKFTVEFYVPKDINYELGEGRILAYADNFAEKKSEAFDVFGNEKIQIGGINENGIKDNQPPKVQLFMNNTHFANGGITNENPSFLACITDDTGINSTGSGIGHDITAYLDGEVVNTFVLNEFYNSGEGNGCVNPSLASYQKGNVMYPFKNLKPGKHTLTFKVWDINNNSTTESLDFIVKDEASYHLVVNKLLNWPNPFTDKTYIQFEHNCDDILEVNVQIYTITGKLVRNFSRIVSSDPFMEGYRTPKQAIEWDGKDDFGDAVGKGTYIYKVWVRSQNQEQCKGSATQVEKMVLLK